MAVLPSFFTVSGFGVGRGMGSFFGACSGFRSISMIPFRTLGLLGRDRSAPGFGRAWYNWDEMDQHLVSAAALDEPIRERQRVVEQALVYATRCAKEAGDAEALAVAAFLHRHSVAGIPLPGDRIGISQTARKRLPSPAVLLVPVIGTDTFVLADDDMGKRYADPLGQSPAFGSYYRSHHAIYWSRAWNISSAWEGLLLLHEGLHAHQHLIDAASPATRREREHDAVALEYRVLCGRGGRGYRDLVAGLSRHSTTYNSRSARLHATDAVLDGLFGAPISTLDEQARDNFVDRSVRLERRRQRGTRSKRAVQH
jgi:hypothetical protein